MLAQEESVEVHALRKRGWSISAIARHVGRDRKTVRAHLTGEHVPGRRRPAESVRYLRGLCWAAAGRRPPPLGDGFVRRSDRAGLWAEGRSSGSATSGCGRRVGRVREPGPTSVVIDHPPGEECRGTGSRLGDTPWGSTVFVLVGTLSHSGRFRAWISSRQDQAQKACCVSRSKPPKLPSGRLDAVR